jgi:hypothetical protein
MDNVVLANGSRGNSRLKSFLRNLNSLEDCDREVLAIANALRENKGLVELHMTYDLDQSYVLRVTWNAVCNSLKTHPTLEVLNLWSRNPTLEVLNLWSRDPTLEVLNLWSRDTPLPPAVLKTRVQALVDMMKVNMLIQYHTLGFLL